MIQQLLRICSILMPYTIILADIIDNGIVGEPVIECGSENLSVRFTTRSPFEGHIYVKGHYWTDDCRSDASLQKTANLTIAFANCDVLRQRSDRKYFLDKNLDALNMHISRSGSDKTSYTKRKWMNYFLYKNHPRGLMLTATIIISFHPMFVTKIDKSYKVQCFYAEAATTVTQNLNVSEGEDMQMNVLVVNGDEGAAPARRPASILHDDTYKSTEDTITSTAPLPECRYQVLDGGKDGNPLNYASVGQLIYHEWTCDPEGTLGEDSPFCATVHSCNVREDGGREVLLLDENGCAIDRYLLNNLEYTSDLTGGQISQVFKFADQNSLFFQCQIRLSLKEGPICKRSSDDCPKVLRGKRSTGSETHEDNVDVISQYMTVFDIDGTADALPSSQHLRHEEICISHLAAGSLLSLFASSILICTLSISFATYWKVSNDVKIEN